MPPGAGRGRPPTWRCGSGGRGRRRARRERGPWAGGRWRGRSERAGRGRRRAGRVGAGALGEVELSQELVCAIAGFGAGEAEVEAVEVDVLEDGAGAIEGVVLRARRRCRRRADWRDVPPHRCRRCGLRPEVGRARVVQMLMVVVLPAPLGPSRPKSSPSRTAEVDAIDGGDGLLALRRPYAGS